MRAPISQWMTRFIDLVILGLSTTCLAAQPPAQRATHVLHINGPISLHKQVLLNQQLARINPVDPEQEPIPAGLIVLLNSPGGDGEIAMALGRQLRARNAHIFVTGRCDSACVFILASGVVRAALPGSIGVHAGRLTQTDAQGRITREIDASQSLQDSFRLTGFNSQIRHYFNEMGIGHGLLDVILAHPTRQVYTLDTEALYQYGLLGFSNDYLNQRAALYNKADMDHRINRIELFNRTMAVPTRCRSATGSDAEFIRCYNDVLYR